MHSRAMQRNMTASQVLEKYDRGRSKDDIPKRKAGDCSEWTAGEWSGSRPLFGQAREVPTSDVARVRQGSSGRREISFHKQTDQNDISEGKATQKNSEEDR